MANKTKSKSSTTQAGAYKAENRQAKNRKLKLEKQLKLQPNNEQVKTALKNIMYRRKTPTKQEWSASWVRIAKIFKLFEGRFNRDIMSNNPAIASAALDKPFPDKICAIGEIGLLGEIRSVGNIEKRIKEAKRMGFVQVVSAKENHLLRTAIKDLLE